MSATVLPFKQKPVVGTQPPRGPIADRLYFCTTCKGDKFHLDLDGDVWCARCVAWIKNLRVSP